MSIFFIIAVAMAVDAVFGEPRWLWSKIPHPAALIGAVIQWADTRYNAAPFQYAKGIALVIVLIIAGAVAGLMIAALGPWAEAICAAILLAHKSLITHVQAVALGLRRSLAKGRAAVAMIVGRDTYDMDRSDIARAAIESAAENFSDGVIAPAFWFLIGGLPAMIVYKAINTADSMIGYKTAKHLHFGWAAARFDDLLNWIPARLSAVIILLACGKISQWAMVRTYAPLHRSPNAGWPEAAMAYGCAIALSGPRRYDGEVKDYPYINADGRGILSPYDIDGCVRILWRGWWGVFWAMGAMSLIT